jgi:hypothetical protein
MLKKISAIAIKSFALLLVLGTAYQAVAQAATTPSTTTPYPNMAPVDQYLMADRAAEISLARSAVPESIARDAEVQVLCASWFRNGGERQERFRVYRGTGVDFRCGS